MTNNERVKIFRDTAVEWTVAQNKFPSVINAEQQIDALFPSNGPDNDNENIQKWFVEEYPSEEPDVLIGTAKAILNQYYKDKRSYTPRKVVSVAEALRRGDEGLANYIAASEWD